MVGISIVLGNGFSKWIGSEDMTVNELLESDAIDPWDVSELEICGCKSIPNLEEYYNLRLLVIEFVDPKILLPAGYFDSFLDLLHLEIAYRPSLPKGLPTLLVSRREGVILRSAPLPSLLEIAGRRVVLLCKAMK